MASPNERDNRRLRDTMVGADDLLDALRHTHRLVSRLRDRGLAGVAEAQAAHDALIALRGLMVGLMRGRR